MYLQACITTVVSGMCNAWVAILVSPFFIQAIQVNVYSGSYLVVSLLVSSTSACVVTFIHALACFFTPRLMQPPKIVSLLVDKLSTLSLTDLVQPGTLTNFFTMGNGVSSKEKASRNFIINCASAVSMACTVYVCWWKNIKKEIYKNFLLQNFIGSWVLLSFPSLTLSVPLSQVLGL